MLERIAREHTVELRILQSNHEGPLIDALHAARTWAEGVLINPGAFTHYAYAITDALAAYDGIKVELHLSNPSAREEWRHSSVIGAVVTGTIAGFGAHGYRLAIEAVVAKLGEGS